MKRSVSCITNRQDINLSQAKRTRLNALARSEEESIDHSKDISPPFSSQKKVSKSMPQKSNESTSNDETNHHNDSNITTSTPSRSTISFSSTSSSSKGISSSTPKFRTETHRTSNVLASVQNKGHQKKLVHANRSTLSGKKATEKVPTKENKRSSFVMADPSDTFDETASSYPKTTSPFFNNNNRTTNTQNSSRCSNPNKTFIADQPSSSSSITTTSNTTTAAVHSLVEGSLEFRELKRMYSREKQQAEEWLKDYKVLKRHIAHLKATTIPRPTAEVVEWLNELLDLMANRGAFRGDGRSLEQIANDLKLDETSLITVAARTPKKSALKIFRLLYPTISSRADLGSISKVPIKELDNIYFYVRSLHKNLSFSKANMKKALGTSIRSATCELRKLERYSQQQSNTAENLDLDERNEEINVTSDVDVVLDENDDMIFDDAEENEENDDGQDEDEDEDEDDDEDADDEENLIIDEELDEDEDDD